MTCTGCSTAVLPTSVGWVHADTHNTVGPDGHHAQPVFDSPRMFLPIGVAA